MASTRFLLAALMGALLACSAVAEGPIAVTRTNGTAEEGSEEYTTVWTTIAELFERKNNTQTVAALVDAVADEPAAADLVAAINAFNFTATVFLPGDEFVPEDAAAELLSRPPAEIIDVLKYHVVPAEKYQLGDFYDGQVLPTLLEGQSLTVKRASRENKPVLITSSGQEVAIYQYKLLAGDSEVYIVKGVLIPGTNVTAPPPSSP